MRRRRIENKSQSSRKAEALQTMPLKQVLEKAERMRKENFREAIVFLNSQTEAREIDMKGIEKNISYNVNLMNEIELIKEKKMEIGSEYAFTEAFR